MSDLPHPTEVTNRILMPDFVAVFKGIPEPKMPELSLTQCFSYVGAIRDSLVQRYGDESDTAIKIDEEEVPNEISALLQLQKRLILSDAYQDFVIKVTKEAVDELSRNTQFIEQLKGKNWASLTNDQRINKCQEFHDTIMRCSQNALKEYNGYEPLAQTADAVWIFDDYSPPTISKKDGKKQITHGSALINHEKAPGCEQIELNTHPKAALHDAIMAMSTTAHETAHVIEGLFAFMYGHNPDFIPTVFQKDAEMLFKMHKEKGYVEPNISSVYRAQANEKLARKAGHEAAQIFRQAIMNMLKSPGRGYIPSNYP